ncbi:MAG: Sb-PDE family phosphodiesterase [Bacteroidota bacterium]
MRPLFSFIVLALFSQSFSLDAQDLNNVKEPQLNKENSRKIIQIPDIPGYTTLKCDFHTHTVFSDGMVWPTVRITEAWQEGLDAIAITDHIEYLPHEEHVKGDFNSSYEIARPLAEKLDVILIRGGEITRDMPPGHLNGLFLEDVNALDTSDPEDALQAVVDQDGFVMWNHPGWKAQQHDTCQWMEMHQDLFEKGLIHGIEVFNSAEWYPVAIDWCVEKDLTMLGNSDIHDVTSHNYDLENGHRPMTLVFAEERTRESIREALFEKRTVAWFGDKMIGRKNILTQLFQASLDITENEVSDENQTILKVKNMADFPFHLSDGKGFEKTIPALSEAIVCLPEDQDRFEVTNLIVGTEKVLETAFPF